MTPRCAPARRATAIERAVVPGLLLLGVAQAAVGLLMAIDPHLFFSQVASFAPENDHFIRDNATFALALGLALLCSVRAPSWRLPLVSLAALQFTLHALNHLADVDSAAQGVPNLVMISLGASALIAILFGELRRLGRDRR